MNNYKCINPKNYKLTLNKEYTPIQVEGGYIHIINDENNAVKYLTSFFEEIPEVAVVPKTEQEVIDSINYNHSNKTITFSDFSNINIEINVPLTSDTSDISCGIIETIGIKALMINICGAVDNLQIRKELLKQAILSYLRDLEEIDDNEYAIALMSTNIELEEDGVPDELVDYLDTFCDCNTEELNNPNSGNEIKMWGFYYQNI